MRLAYVTSHPIQYQAPVFRALAAAPDVDFKAFFAWDFGVQERVDPNFGRSVKWDVPLLSGYEHEFVPNLARDPGAHHFFGLVNPSIALSLRRFRPDVVIVHGYAHVTELVAILASSLAGVPVLIRGDSNLLGHRRALVRFTKALGAAFLRTQLAGALAIGTLNREYWRYYGIPEARIFHAPYCVDNAFFQADPDKTRARAAAWRNELGIAPATRVVGYTGKLYDVKDLRTLVEAFGRAHTPDSALVLVGDGPLRGALEAQATRFPDAQIKFAGFVNQSDMPAAYAMLDVFAMTSTSDAWGLSVNEAMCLGLPIIVSDQVGCGVDLVKADNGWTFAARDVAGLTAILGDVLRAPAESLAARGAASRARIADWSIERSAQATIDAARVVARTPSRRAA